LTALLEQDPYHARANLRMATLQLRQFDASQQAGDNPMGLMQIRDAALASQFPSRAAQDRWLGRLMGDNRRHLDWALQYTKRALRLCPLQGEGYIYLAELAFLEQASSDLEHACIDQALRVRPHNGVVLLAAGSEAATDGDAERAMELWKRAFHQDPEQQTRIIDLLAPYMSAEEFLDEFTPDREALQSVFAFYRERGQLQDAHTAGSRLAALLERDAGHEAGWKAAVLWDEAGAIQEFLGDAQGAADCARNAVFYTPDHYRRRLRLADRLLGTGQHAEAVAQLRWCLSRKPDDGEVRRKWEVANRQRLARRSEATQY
jgi:tetratricopeptide (TPR) repeat protein